MNAWRRFLQKKSQEPQRPKVPELRPGVSLAVCCYNSSQTIEKTMTALAKQKRDPLTIPALEAILVDNNSNDDTVMKARRVWKREAPGFPLKVIREPEPGLIHARKAAAEAACHDVIVYLDDDNLLEPGWAAGGYECFNQNPRAGAIGGFNEALLTTAEPEWFRDYLHVYACRREDVEPGVLPLKKILFGAGLAARTKLIRTIFHGSFPLTMVGRKGNALTRGEDAEICLRLQLMGWDLVYEKSLMLQHVIHPERLKWEYVLSCRYQAGRADVFLMMYHHLLEKRPPFTYAQLSWHICRRWEELWHGVNDAGLMGREGSIKSFTHAYLKGLTEGFRDVGEEAYECIRANLTEYVRSLSTPDAAHESVQPNVLGGVESHFQTDSHPPENSKN